MRATIEQHRTAIKVLKNRSGCWCYPETEIVSDLQGERDRRGLIRLHDGRCLMVQFLMREDLSKGGPMAKGKKKGGKKPKKDKKGC